MSRCFPYAPPPHLRDGPRSEAVSEPFKLKLPTQKNENVITEHGKVKKDREERKKEKKDKRSEKKLRKEKGKVDNASLEVNKKRKEVTTESSSITEELGEPVYTQQSPCYLSDGSRSNKRRKVDQLGSSDVGAAVSVVGKTSGNILRFRLPLRKKEPDVSTSVSAVPADSVPQQNGVFSNRTNAIPADSVPQQNGVFSNRTQDKASCSVDYSQKNGSSDRVPMSEMTLSDSKLQIPLLDEKAQPKMSKKEKKTHKIDSLYKSLVEDFNWNISTSQFELKDDDQEWLFGMKEKDRIKSVKACQDVPCLPSYSWPTATYLPEVDVYALPYTIPF